VAFLHILCFNRNPNPNPNPVNLKAKNIEYAKSHIRQNSRESDYELLPGVHNFIAIHGTSLTSLTRLYQVPNREKVELQEEQHRQWEAWEKFEGNCQ